MMGKERGKQRVEVIGIHRATRKSSRKLAAQFDCGKTQIENILKRRREILEEYEHRAPPGRKRKRATGNEDLNQLCWEWFGEMTARRVPVSGSMLQAEARRLAAELGHADFKASNGWLDSFRKRHGIAFGGAGAAAAARERGEGEPARDPSQGWTDWLPAALESYSTRDIYSLGEAGLYYRARQSGVGGDWECGGGERAGDRLTVMLCASLAGDKERPVVVGRSAEPRCFRNIGVGSLPVDYHGNRTSWLTSQVFEDYLRRFDRRLGGQSRQALLFLRNAPSHPDLRLKNLKLVFFPPNATSALQPMDQGIIRSLKLRYREKQLNRVARELDGERSAVSKGTTVLEAVYWISQSWADVDPGLITECFSKAGFPVPDTSEVALDHGVGVASEHQAPVALEDLCGRVFGCGVQELVDLDKDLATCNNNIDLDGTVSELTRTQGQPHSEEEESGSDRESEHPPATSQAASLKAVWPHVEALKDFCLTLGHADVLELMMRVEAKLCEKHGQNVARESALVGKQ
uniref:HTH CENPB-type domain-containing protein n=1 Tax=Callorhinchus milii TaxID=7868 RepID=A0A4W3HV52_CALMI